MPRLRLVGGELPLRPTCKDMTRREFMKDGKPFVEFKECKLPSKFGGMCLQHYVEFAREMLSENEATIRGMTTLIFELRAELRKQTTKAEKLHRALVTKLHPEEKLRGGSVSQSFVGSNG